MWNYDVFVPKRVRKNLQSKVWFSTKRRDLLAKYLTKYFGSIWFLCALLLVVLTWIIINNGLITGVEPIDPYPFILLVMIVQLFEVFLSVIVLISQNRQGDIAEVRQQIDLEVNVRAENEITKILHMLEEIKKELGIDRKDLELEKMKMQTDITEIKKEVEQAIVDDKKVSSEENPQLG